MAALAVLLSAMAPSVRASIIIDSFSISSNANVTLGADVPPDPPVYSGPNGVTPGVANAIFGSRMMASYVTAGLEEDQYRFRVSNVTGFATVETSAFVAGRGLLTYNGATSLNSGVTAGQFNAPSNFNATGLDITEGGANTGVILNGYADNNGLPVIFTFWTNAGTYASGKLILPGSGAMSPHYLSFVNFIATGNTLLNILQDVRAVTVELDGTAPGVSRGTDVVLDYLIAGPSLDASVPEPGTYMLIGSALLGLGFLRRRATKA